MEFKKGFTLAEILIVLVLMGVLAVLVVPILTINLQNAHFKTAYKRAFNIMATIMSIETSQGDFPHVNAYESDETYLRAMHDALVQNVSFKDYWDESNEQVLNELPENPDYSALWINTEDGLSYKIQGQLTQEIKRKSQINTFSTLDELTNSSLYYIFVDTNGRNKGPNCIDEKITAGLQEGEDFEPLKCDRYPIYIASDGVAAGDRTKTITGHILAEK